MRPRAVVGVAVAADRGPRLGRREGGPPRASPSARGARRRRCRAPPVAAPRRCPRRVPPSRPPPPLRAPTVHADGDLGPRGEARAGGLRAPAGVGDPRPAVAAERLLQRLDAQAGRQRGRRPPGHPGSRPGQALRLEGRAVAPPRSPRPGPPRRRHHADLARSVPSARPRPDPPGRLCCSNGSRASRTPIASTRRWGIIHRPRWSAWQAGRLRPDGAGSTKPAARGRRA